jgi:hypothetical protein
LEVASAETFDDERKNTDIDVKSSELENVADEPSEQKDLSIEPSNATELHIDQIKSIAEQDQESQESDAKPTDQDQAKDDISAMESSDVNTTVSASVEKNGEESVAKEENVILHEESVAVEMSEEEAEKMEAENEKHTEEEASFYLLMNSSLCCLNIPVNQFCFEAPGIFLITQKIYLRLEINLVR